MKGLGLEEKEGEILSGYKDTERELVVIEKCSFSMLAEPEIRDHFLSKLKEHEGEKFDIVLYGLLTEACIL